MPWAEKDVAKINPSCPVDLRRMWVKVAIDTLRRCTLHGGKDCEATAIKRADKAISVFAKTRKG